MEAHSTNPAIQLSRVHLLIAAFNAGNVAAYAQHLASNVSWRRGDGTSLESKTAVIDQLQNLFHAFPDGVLTAINVQAFPPNVVLVEWSLEATHLAEWWSPGTSSPPTFRPVGTIGADLLTFNAANEIESDEARIDTAAFLASVDPPANTDVRDLATRYTAAWNSRNPANVAEFYAPQASLRVNNAAPAIGREAVAQVAQSFMTDFPDMELTCDRVRAQANRAVYLWTFAGTHKVTRKRVRFSGYEVWRIGADGLIAESRGYFDSAGYDRQLRQGVEAG